MTRQFTAIIEREDDGYVALCPELDIASQGDTIDSARTNLQEALELFLETASPEEIKRSGTVRVRNVNAAELSSQPAGPGTPAARAPATRRSRS